MTARPLQNWFYTELPVRMPGESERYAYHLIPGRESRPGNLEDQLVDAFLGNTNQPEWVGDDVEGELRIALRRAADAAVRTTLDAEKPAGVVYETAEEREAKKASLEQIKGFETKNIENQLRIIQQGERQLVTAEDQHAQSVALFESQNAILERIANALEKKAVQS